jgi:hypothetical protein
MASIYGTSGAWNAIIAQLERYQLQVKQPGEIELLLQDCLRDYESQFEQAKQALEAEIGQLENEIAEEKEKVRAALEKFNEEHALEIKQAELHVDFYRQERSLFNFVRRFFRIRRETGKLDGLQKTRQEYENVIGHDLHEKAARLVEIKANKNHLAQGACHEAHARVELLKSLSTSPELARALVELEMIEILARLPDEVHVLNDLQLRTDRGIRLDGEWLIQGQINNLVITPAGLFAIEIYGGNQPAAQKGGETDPSDQIKRAAQLCYAYLKPKFPAATVRGVLAYRGHLPDNQKTGIVKTLPINEVPGYINWFKDKTLSEAALKEIVQFIQEWATQEHFV